MTHHNFDKLIDIGQMTAERIDQLNEISDIIGEHTQRVKQERKYLEFSGKNKRGYKI